jgi:hypothetical protein
MTRPLSHVTACFDTYPLSILWAGHVRAYGRRMPPARLDWIGLAALNGTKKTSRFLPSVNLKKTTRSREVISVRWWQRARGVKERRQAAALQSELATAGWCRCGVRELAPAPRALAASHWLCPWEQDREQPPRFFSKILPSLQTAIPKETTHIREIIAVPLLGCIRDMDQAMAAPSRLGISGPAVPASLPAICSLKELWAAS